jgi:hypothetical protein
LKFLKIAFSKPCKISIAIKNAMLATAINIEKKKIPYLFEKIYMEEEKDIGFLFPSIYFLLHSTRS